MKTLAFLFLVPVLVCAQVQSTNDLFSGQPLRPDHLKMAQTVRAREGTNFWGVYHGISFKPDHHGGVIEFDASTGAQLKTITLEQFTNWMVLKKRTYYPTRGLPVEQ